MKAICGRGRTLLRRSGALSAAVAAGALCVLALAGPASAAGAGAVSFTQHFSNVVVDQEATANPCTGASGTLTQIADNGVAHITILTSGQEPERSGPHSPPPERRHSCPMTPHSPATPESSPPGTGRTAT